LVNLRITKQRNYHSTTHKAKMAPTTSFLKVSGDKIVKSDDPSETPVLLRGAGLGGWMNMENVSFVSQSPSSPFFLAFMEWKLWGLTAC
jgi:hypothetical protein